MQHNTALVREYLQLIADKDQEIARLKRQIEELRGAIEALRDGATVKFPDKIGNSGLIVSQDWC